MDFHPCMGHLHHKKLCLHLFKKHLYQNQKSRLAFIEKLTFKLMVQSLSSAWLGAWYLYFAFVKTRKDERGIKQIWMKNESKWLRHFHSCTIIHCTTHCIRYMFSYLNRDARWKRVLHSIKASERPSEGRRKFRQIRVFKKKISTSLAS